jgi:hypothetical protein
VLKRAEMIKISLNVVAAANGLLLLAEPSPLSTHAYIHIFA